MKKKIMSLLSSAVLAFPLFQITADAAPAEQLPFTLTPPEHIVAITDPNVDDSLCDCVVAWSKNISMNDWSMKMLYSRDEAAKALNAMGYDSLWYTPQIDWSIDTTTDWHYNQYWDTWGFDENHVQHLGEWAYTSLLQDDGLTSAASIFGDMGDISDPDNTAWYGSHADGADYIGWKDVLKEGQYTVVADENGGKHAKLNFTDHTVNVRMRWLVTVCKLDGDEVNIASDWSEIVSAGKGVTSPAAVLKSGSVPAPVIRDLRYADEQINGYPVVAFHVDLTDAVMNALTLAKAVYGDLILDAQARVQNGEWIELFGDQRLKSGEMEMCLQELAEHEKDIAKDTPIELRCRYIYEPYNGTDEEYPTEFSDVLTFGAQDMHVLPQETVLITARTRRAAEMTANDCRGPGSEEEQEGQSIFDGPWILLIILAVIVLLIIIFLLSRRNKEDKK